MDLHGALPKCPYCEVEWPEGPESRDYASDIRVVYCPACSKVVAVLPVSIMTL